MQSCSNKLIIGASGSGKTHYIINYLNNSDFDIVYIISKTANICPDYAKINKRSVKFTDFDADVSKKILDLQIKYKKLFKAVIFFDDVIGIFSIRKTASVVSDLFATCRHYNVESIVSIQHLKSCPTVVRDNITEVLHTNHVSQSDLENIYFIIQRHFPNKKVFYDYLDQNRQNYRVFVYRVTFVADGRDDYWFV